jgi:hypothetical protein
MQTIEVITDGLLKTIENTIPKVASDEKYTAMLVCRVALYHAESAISQKSDHFRAAQCLFALSPFRRLTKEDPNDLLSAGYTCAVALKRNKIDEADYISEMIKRLGGVLSEEDRTSRDKWVDKHSTDLPAFRPENEAEGWAMVQLMLDGESYFGAALDLHEQRQLVLKWKQLLDQRNDQNKLSAKSPSGKNLSRKNLL